jgi:hypothetical protein
MLERMIPLMRQKTQLEQQLQVVRPHPEMSDEEREQAARAAIDDAFVKDESKSDRATQISERDIRKQFPEELDEVSWKAVLKALQNSASSDEIVRDVFNCGGQLLLGKAYLDLLKRKFID